MLTADSRVDLGAGSGGTETGAIALDRMVEGGLDAAFFIVPVPRVPTTAEGYESARRAALGGITRFGKMIPDRAGRIGLGLSPDDAYRLEKEGRHTAFIGLASGDALGNDLSLVETYHAKGRIVYLPPYQPALNMQERIWRQIRYESTTNRWFDNLEAIWATVQKTLDSWSKHKVRRLCNIT